MSLLEQSTGVFLEINSIHLFENMDNVIKYTELEIERESGIHNVQS